MNRLQEELRKNFTVQRRLENAEVPAGDGITVNAKESKTRIMKMLEEQFHQPIEYLISVERSGRDCAIMLGVDESTITKWRQRLGLLGKKGKNWRAYE